MIRNLKDLSLATVAAFALSAVGASSAQALEVNSPEGVTITATQISVGEHTAHEITVSSGRKFACNNALYEGTIENGATEVTVTPKLSNCFSNGTQPTTVTHNGCSARLYGSALNNITVDLVCPEGKEMEVHAYSNATNHTNGIVMCRFTVAPFVGKHKNEVTTTENGGIHDIDVTTSVTNITVKRVTGSPIICGGENQTGIYTGATTVQAFSDTAHKVPVDLTVE